MKRLLVLCGALATPAGAFALGIRLFDHDAFATARGDAFVATADNASAVYYNPAGIGQMPGQNVRGGVYSVDVHSEFSPAGTGRDWETRDDFIPLPGFFYTYAPEDKPFAFGAGYYLPFGLSLEWPGNSPFRTVTTRGELVYNTVTAVAAWKILPTLTIAAGPTFNFARVDLRRGIAAAGDEFRFHGDDMDWGGSAGILWQPAPKHSFGISYKSQTTMDLQGRSRATPYGIIQHGEVMLPLPQVVVGGYSYRPTTNWNMEVDLDWTDWERIRTLTLKQASGNVALPLNWISSWAVEAGVTRYFCARQLHVSAGYVYIENSTPNHTFDPLVPDQDLHVFSAGVGGEYARLTWDLTYQFTYGPGRSVSQSVYGPAVAGDYSFTAHGISISIGYHF